MSENNLKRRSNISVEKIIRSEFETAARNFDTVRQSNPIARKIKIKSIDNQVVMLIYPLLRIITTELLSQEVFPDEK